MADLRAQENLIAAGDATGWVTPDAGGFTLLRVVLKPHASFTGDVIFQTFHFGDPSADIATDIADILNVSVPAVTATVPMREYLVAVPGGWGLRVTLDDAVNAIAENVLASIGPYPVGGFGSAGAKMTVGPANFAALAAATDGIAAAIAAVDAVIVDLGNDVGGNSVAQAITDLTAASAALAGL